MTKLKQIYKCNVCGNIVEVLHTGAGELVCCGETMQLMEQKKEEVGQEKHLPVIEKMADKVRVKVGSIPHPMEEKHYIEWIEVMANGKSYREFLNPGGPPEATFEIKAEKITAREYCNLHGLWKEGGNQ
ncbi:desulfoferrodoxin [Candidatus Aerophobetes bacterium]|uniref:Desulfoferrodoxin n=1 Tax=Aerophobetes bacterium TaxID=2030807 RepID=A0A523TDG5_UNCAE|nr:MAG: desulfoferrodoxin [Candidatus Aerophobetes bacterium]